MWKKLKEKTIHLFRVIKNAFKGEESVETTYEECLQKLENILNKCSESDIQMQISGKWISKCLFEAISLKNCEQKLLKICRQTEVYRLEDIFGKEILNQMKVLWTGCYSEVRKVNNLNGEDIVLKISLINRLNKEGLVIQNASSIISDVINCKRLSDLKAISVDSADNYCENFANIKSFLYVWSNHLVFNKSEFRGKTDRKSKFEYFISQQTFGGKGLDFVIGLSPTKGLSLVLQLISALAVAEEALHFEHRDLHTSNLLIKRTDDKYYNYSICGQKFHIKLNGIKLVIIDTTFSRTQIEMQSENGKQRIQYIYNDLSSLNLRDYSNSELKKVYLQQKEITKNKWKEFWPKTNIIWIYYCINKIIKKVEKWSQNNEINSNPSFCKHLSKLKQIRVSVCHSESAKQLSEICRTNQYF